VELITDRPGAQVYRVIADRAGGAREEALPTRHLGG
jgi:hypothetical protein